MILVLFPRSWPLAGLEAINLEHSGNFLRFSSNICLWEFEGDRQAKESPFNPRPFNSRCNRLEAVGSGDVAKANYLKGVGKI